MTACKIPGCAAEIPASHARCLDHARELAERRIARERWKSERRERPAS